MKEDSPGQGNPRRAPAHPAAGPLVPFPTAPDANLLLLVSDVSRTCHRPAQTTPDGRACGRTRRVVSSSYDEYHCRRHGREAPAREGAALRALPGCRVVPVHFLPTGLPALCRGQGTEPQQIGDRLHYRHGGPDGAFAFALCAALHDPPELEGTGLASLDPAGAGHVRRAFRPLDRGWLRLYLSRVRPAVDFEIQPGAGPQSELAQRHHPFHRLAVHVFFLPPVRAVEPPAGRAASSRHECEGGRAPRAEVPGQPAFSLQLAQQSTCPHRRGCTAGPRGRHAAGQHAALLASVGPARDRAVRGRAPHRGGLSRARADPPREPPARPLGHCSQRPPAQCAADVAADPGRERGQIRHRSPP